VVPFRKIKEPYFYYKLQLLTPIDPFELRELMEYKIGKIKEGKCKK